MVSHDALRVHEAGTRVKYHYVRTTYVHLPSVSRGESPEIREGG